MKKSELISLIKEQISILTESIEKEYVIWGIPPNGKEEVLLMAKFEGKHITDKNVADRLGNILKTTHNCKNIRIQTIDFNTNIDFASTIKEDKNNKIELTFLKVDEDTGNLIYVGSNKKKYASVDGIIYSMTPYGEPDYPMYDGVVIKKGEYIYDTKDRFGRKIDNGTSTSIQK